MSGSAGDRAVQVSSSWIAWCLCLVLPQQGLLQSAKLGLARVFWLTLVLSSATWTGLGCPCCFGQFRQCRQQAYHCRSLWSPGHVGDDVGFLGWSCGWPMLLGLRLLYKSFGTRELGNVGRCVLPVARSGGVRLFVECGYSKVLTEVRDRLSLIERFFVAALCEARFVASGQLVIRVENVSVDPLKHLCLAELAWRDSIHVTCKLRLKWLVQSSVLSNNATYHFLDVPVEQRQRAQAEPPRLGLAYALNLRGHSRVSTQLQTALRAQHLTRKHVLRSAATFPHRAGGLRVRHSSQSSLCRRRRRCHCSTGAGAASRLGRFVGEFSLFLEPAPYSLFLAPCISALSSGLLQNPNSTPTARTIGFATVSESS